MSYKFGFCVFLFVLLSNSKICYGQSSNYYYDLAISNYEQKKYQEAINYCNKIEYDYMKSPSYFHLRGLCYYEIKNYKKALSDFHTLISLSTNNHKDYSKLKPEYVFGRGLIYYYLEEYNFAISDFTFAIEKDPDNADIYFFRGDSNIKLKKYKKAADDLFIAINLNPDLIKNKYRIIATNDLTSRLFEMDTAKIHEAICFFNALIAYDSKDVVSYAQRGEAYIYINDFSNAYSDYCNAIFLSPDDAGLYIQRGKINFKLEKFEDAELDYNNAVRFDCKKVSEIFPENVFEYWYKGNALFTLNDLQKAEEEYSTSIDKDTNRIIEKYIDCESDISSNNFTAFGYHGRAHHLSSNFESAIKDYTKALNLNPEFEFIRYLLSAAFFSTGRVDDAIYEIRKFITGNEVFAPAYGNLGYYLLDKGNVQEAIVQFNKCLELDSYNLDAALGLSLAYFLNKDKKNAKVFLQKAQKLQPILKNGMAGISKLESQGYWYSKNQKTLFTKLFSTIK